MKKTSDTSSSVSRRQFLMKTGLSLAGITTLSSTVHANGLLESLPAGNLKQKMHENGFSDDPLIKLGYLNAKYYAKGDGITDDTMNLRKAMIDAQYSQLVLYLPAGTYLISDMLDFEHWRQGIGFFNHGMNDPDPFMPSEKRLEGYGIYGFFIQGDPDDRPVIRLKDNAKGFENGSIPRYVLRIWENADSWKPVMSYVPEIIEGIREFGGGFMNHAGVSSIIIDCGKGNPGAVGFKLWGCQATYVENITVRAYGALAGVRDLIGNGGYMANIEVYGGKYGVWAKRGHPGCIAGLTLIDQDEEAIFLEMPTFPFSMVGFRIVKNQGPVIKINKTTKLNVGYHLSLTDGTVELKTKGTAFVIKKDEGGVAGNLYLRNVYVKNADVLVSTPGDESLKSLKAEWNHIHEYCGTSSDSVNVVDGKECGKSAILDKKKPPTNILALHMLSRADMPFGLDKDAVNVCDPDLMGKHSATGDGITDDTASIQYAINNFDKIFLPKGNYSITSPLRLGKKTKLFGITSALTMIKTDVKNWKAENEMAVFTTLDDAESTCMASQISVFTASGDSGSKFRIMEWKAGRNSVVKNIVAAPFRYNEQYGTLPPVDNLVLITGNGGGRKYGDSIGAFYYVHDVDETSPYRHMLCLNTREPLRFYTYNPEHACSDAEVEIRSCENIEIYGIKTEGGHTCKITGKLFVITGSKNIYFTVMGNNGRRTTPGNSFFHVNQCDNITITTASNTPRNWGDFLVISEERDGAKIITIPVSKNVGLFRRGDPIRFGE
jgi:hypothetical protein